MKYETATLLIAFFGLTVAAPMPKAYPAYTIRGREVPQEKSHNKFLDSVRTSLDLNNPNEIEDPVFGLLGNAAAIAGIGKLTTGPDCLHQETADQAFTNAKAAGDVQGQADALIYATLERNTGKVGLASVLCNSTAVNPEIAALSQHQDPASAGAAATNKGIVLELAKQLAAIGADPQEALQSGTFKAGSVTDSTGAGNTCDTADDTEGCIFTLNLLVDDATAEEITAAVAGISSSSGSDAASVTTASATLESTASACAAGVIVTVTASAAADTAPAATKPAAAVATTAAASSTSTASGANIQTFTGTLGGAAPPVIQSTGDRPFSVLGDTFVNSSAALQRSCSVQNNACSNAANSGTISASVSECGDQETKCNALI